MTKTKKEMESPRKGENPTYQAEMEATKKWVGRDFSSIPGALIERAYRDAKGFEDLQLLAGGQRQSDCCDAEVKPVAFAKGWKEKLAGTKAGEAKWSCEKCGDLCEVHWTGSEHAWPAGWGTLWIPDSMDADWIKEHAEEVADVGFIVYESDECGVLLGIDGGGYDFYDAHWLPLYRLRGLKWHE